MIHISKKNIKLGNIPNISLPPILTCEDKPPCAAKCYARKAYEGYAANTCKPAWDENLAEYKEDEISYFEQITSFLHKHPKMTHFRWHVSGDIPDATYYTWMLVVATTNPTVKFVCYSRKSFELPEPFGAIPANFTMLRSIWLWEEDPELYKGAWFKVVPKNVAIDPAFVCPGRCDKCYACWNLKAGEGRVIHLH